MIGRHNIVFILILSFNNTKIYPMQQSYWQAAKSSLMRLAKPLQQVLPLISKARLYITKKVQDHKITYSAAAITTMAVTILANRQRIQQCGKDLIHQIFFKAAETGNARLVKFFIDLGIPLEIQDNDGDTPLHCAACCGQLPIVEQLLAAGAQIDPKDHDGDTPLHLAAGSNHSAIATLLLKAGANKDSQNNGHMTPLVYAAFNGHHKTVRILLEAKAQIDIHASIIDTESEETVEATALHIAVCNKQAETVQALLDAGSNIEERLRVIGAQGRFDMSALYLSVHKDDLEISKILLKAGANPNIQGKNQNSPLHEAAKNGNIKLVKTLLAAGANPNSLNHKHKTPLHKAAKHGNLEIVRLLIIAGANPQAQDVQGQTAFAIATAHIQLFLNELPRFAMKLQKAVRLHNFASKCYWIRLGASLIDDHGDCLIHKAIGDYVKANPTPVDHYVGKLLKTIGKITSGIRNSRGQTPLHIAAMRGNCWIAEYLLRHGANVNSRDDLGYTPLHYASTSGMRDKLLRHGANVALINYDGQTPLSANPAAWQSIWTQP